MEFLFAIRARVDPCGPTNSAEDPILLPGCLPSGIQPASTASPVTFLVPVQGCCQLPWTGSIAHRPLLETHFLCPRRLRWSDLAPFELDRDALLWNRVFVVAAAVALLRVATLAYGRVQGDAAQRPEDPGWPVVARWWPVAVALVPFAVLFVGVRTGSEAKAEAAALAYVRSHHETYRDARLPAIAELELDLSIVPEDRAFVAEGSYLLENIDDEPLEELPLTLGSHFTDVSLELDGEPVAASPRAGLVVIAFTPLLAPGQRRELRFAHRGQIARGTASVV